MASQHERAEQADGCERRRADGEPFADGGGGVADGIEVVGDLTDFRVEPGHFGDAAGVIGNRPVGVDGHDHAGGGQHAEGGNGDAVYAAA